MNGTFYHLISGYAKSYLLTIFMVSNIALLSTLAKSGHFYESSSKKVANFAEKSKNISVSDSILSFDEAEILEGSINFIEMEKEIAANLNLSPQDGELYWQYLQSQIHQDKLDFLNGGYKSYTASGFPNYVTAITQSYINQYAAFLPNKAAFELQMAEQNALNNVQAVPVGPCTNMGFTNGLTGWTVRNGDAATTCITNAPAAPCAGAAGQAATPRVTVKAAGFDPIVPTLPLVPPGATNSAMIEDYLNGGHISMLSQTFAVTATNNVFTYKYAVVLENPIGGHTYNQRPFFKVTMSASTSGNIQCGDYYQVVDPPFVSGFDSMKVVDPYKAQDPVNDPDNNPMDIYYRPWTTITIPLQAYVGQNVTVTFIASDCEPGGHRGYAYVWAECSALPPIQTSSICLSEVLSYTVPAGFQSYKWEGPGIVGRTDTSIVKVDQPGNYDLILTSIPTTDTTLPCYDTLKFIVLQHCAPPPIDTALCETVQGSGTTTGVNLNNYNTKITAFNPTGTVQGWYSGKPATTANKIATPTNVTVSNGGKYYAVITYPTIGGDTAELDFVVNPLPVINFPAISPLCQGGPAYQITGVTPGGGTFSGTNVTATGLFTPSAVGSYTIKYVYTNANGCTNSATQTIVVNPPPTATAANQTVCSTVSTISLSGTVTNASGEKWIGGSGSFSNSAILTPTYTPTATELAGTSIKLDLIALPLSGCSADTQKITITVVAAPKVTAHDTTICATTSSIVITRATENNAASIAWSAPSGSFSNTSILASTYTPTITTGSVILTLTGNANSPCANTSTTMNVTVVPAPKVTVHDTTVCSIPTIIINDATASNTASVVWSGAGTFGNANSLVTTYTPPSITSGTVTLKLTGNANSPCANTSTTMNVTVVPAPVVTVADTTICSTTSSIVIARATESNAASVVWSAPSGSFSNTSILASTYTPTITTGSVILTLTGNANAPCANTSTTMKVTVVPAPKVTAHDTTVCSIPTITINTATASNTASVVWSGAGTFGNANSLVTTYTPPSITSGTVTLKLTGNANSPCANTSTTMNVTVVPAPVVTVADTTICSTTSSIVIARVTESNAASIAWSAPSGSFSNTSILASTYTPTITTGSVILTLKGNANSPCANTSATMKVTVVPAPVVSATDTTICFTTPYITTNAKASNVASVVWKDNSNTGTFGNINSLATIYTPTITSGSVTLTLTGVANAPCANVTATAKVTVIPAPKVTTSDTIICATTSSITITSANAINTSSVKWSAPSGSFGNASALSTTYIPSISSGLVTLTLESNANAPCANTSATMNVIVVSAPKVTATDTTICSTIPSITIVRATEKNTAAITWSASSDSGVFVNNSILETIFTPSFTSGTVTLTLTGDANLPCANVSATMKVTVIATPKVTVHDTVICSTTPSVTINTASQSNTTSLIWKDESATGAFNNTGLLSPTYTPTITSGSVWLVLIGVANSPCANVKDSMTVTVIAAPKVTAHDTTVCSVPTIIINDATETNTASVAWSGPGTFGSANSIVTTYTPPSITSGTVKLILTGIANSPCANVKDSMLVTVIPSPVVTVTDTTVCSTTHSISIANATAIDTSSVAWSAPSGSFSNVSSLITTYTLPAITSGTVTLTLLGNAVSPCKNVKDSMIVKVIPAPIVNAGPDQTVCSSSPAVTLAGDTLYVKAFSWSNGTGTITSVSNLQAGYTPSSTEIAAGKATLVLTDTALTPCANITDTISITIIQAPQVNAGPNQTVCATSPAVILAGDTLHVKGFSWGNGTGTFTSVSNLQAGYTPSSTEIAAGKATLILTDMALTPCTNSTDTMSITIIPPPVVNAGPDQVVCLTSALVTLAGDTSNVSGFSWSPVNTLTGGTFASSTILNPQYTPSNADILNGQAVLVLTGMGIVPCASVTDSVSIINIPLPIIQVNDTAVCTGQPAVLKAHVLNRPFFQKYNLTLDWSWQIGATAAPSQDSVLTTKTGGVYHITANASGCTGTDSGTVTLYPLPLANLPASVKFCPDTLSEYPLNAGTGSTYKYFWIPTNDTVSQIYVSAPGEYIVTITTKHNCTASSKTIVQEVCPPRLYISSAFSPNSDGSNDIYDVYSAHVGAFHMLIFNRWGEVIFESQDKNHFWNGVYREDPMPIGVYPWVITYEGDTEEYKGPYNMKGSVTVVR